MEILFVIGIAQAIFFSYLLLIKKGNKPANRLLAFLLVSISFSLLLQYLYVTNHIEQAPHLIGLDSTFPFIYAPLIFLYAKFVTSQKSTFKITDSIHLIPFTVFLVYIFLSFYLKSGSYKYEYLQNLFKGNVPLDLTIVNYLKIIQAVIYVILTLKVIITHQNRIKHIFSNLEKKTLTWLKILTISIAGVYFIQFIVLLLISFKLDWHFQEISLLANVSEVLFVYILAFFGIMQPQIYKTNDQISTNKVDIKSILNKPEEKSITIKQKYAGSPLSTKASKEMFLKLKAFMEKEKPYLESQITIHQIAEKIGVNTKYLSQVINEHVDLNFFNFINQYRIEEVKQKLTNEKYSHLSILGIALDCGFNSKSSFNSVFKKLTGQTPSSYVSCTS
ncbi:MAG: hypothetical protein C0597_04155 [Marinilabiliales bacterium]|nr:MAG: hypothetical protein C0597_04155 [Marinilabiliales bacterium]